MIYKKFQLSIYGKQGIYTYVNVRLKLKIFHDLGPGPTTTLLKFQTRITFAEGLLILVNLCWDVTRLNICTCPICHANSRTVPQKHKKWSELPPGLFVKRHNFVYASKCMDDQLVCWLCITSSDNGEWISLLETRAICILFSHCRNS